MIHTSWLGRVPYGPTLAAQREYRGRVAAGEAPEALWLLEHDPVITTGRRVVQDLPPAEVLSAAGYDLHVTERGGLATCHEPGQLVGYLFVDARSIGVRRLVEAIEEGLIHWLRAQGAAAGRREGYPGVWVAAEKLAAIGIHVGRGVSMHGFALNLVNDRRGFSLITPCGIHDGGVGSVRSVLGTAPTPEEAAQSVGAAVVAAVEAAR